MQQNSSLKILFFIGIRQNIVLVKLKIQFYSGLIRIIVINFSIVKREQTGLQANNKTFQKP